MAIEEPPRLDLPYVDQPCLGCGRSIDGIWAAIDRAPTMHEEQCAQCQAARARLKNLSEATRSLRERDRHNPALKPDPGIKTAIMDVARAEARRGSRVLLLDNERGTVEISEQALGSVIRQAPTAIPGIHARRCHIELHPVATRASGLNSSGQDRPSTNTGATTGIGTGLMTSGLVISLRVAAAADIDMPRTADALRRRISTAVVAGVGISAGIINITVEDLYDV